VQAANPTVEKPKAAEKVKQGDVTKQEQKMLDRLNMEQRVMEDDMDMVRPTTMERVEQLQRLGQTPLQRLAPAVNAVAQAGAGSGPGGGLGKDVLDFDKRFFQR